MHAVSHILFLYQYTSRLSLMLDHAPMNFLFVIIVDVDILFPLTSCAFCQLLDLHFQFLSAT
ncbi:GSCOCG00001197001-RA-CDS [Cotesia congregata]|nr:GSCOCG00001197001-RA-CDS [Cotesia congregata]